jgi:hypothetical protein
LAVYFSEDCGFTKELIYVKGGELLATAADFASDRWVPASEEWRTETVFDLPLNHTGDLSIIFENRGRYGQPIYLDNLGLAYSIGNEDVDETQLNIYPTPAVQIVQVEIQSNNQILPFKVLDLTGRIVQQGVFSSGSNQLNVENLIPGVFVLEINDNGNSISRKIIKQ